MGGTETRPHSRTQGTGRSILAHQLDWLAEERVTDVVVSCGHLAGILQLWLESADLPLRVSTVVEAEPLGRGGGLREMASFHHQQSAVATLALARPRIPWGVVELDESGRITDFVEAPPTPWPVNAGLYVFSPEFPGAGPLPPPGWLPHPRGHLLARHRHG